MHRGNKVSKGLNLVVIHPPFNAGKGTEIGRRAVRPKTHFFAGSSDMESSPDT